MNCDGASVNLPKHASPSTTPHRQVGWDNCRSLFMFYVVMFHFFNNWSLEQATIEWNEPWAHVFSSYTFWNERLAVPGFCFLSGLMSKGYDEFPAVKTTSCGQQSKVLKRWKASMSTLLVGSFNIQLLNYILYILLANIIFRQASPEAESTAGNSFFPPTILNYDHVETWYFIALFGWRFVTPIFLRLIRYPLTTSLVLAVLNSHVAFDQDAHVRMRFFRLFPCYVAGLLWDKSVLDRIQRPVLWGGIGLASTLLLTICLEASTQRILFVVQYFDMDWSLQSLGILAFQYIYSAVLVLSAILLLRQSTVPLFPFGHANSTLAIYCWHWRILDFFLWGQIPFTRSQRDWTPGAPVMDYFKSCIGSKSLFLDPLHHPLVAIVLLHFGSYCICVALGSKSMWQVFRYVNDPDCDWMFRKHPENIQTSGSEQDVPSEVYSHKHTPTNSDKQCRYYS